MIESVLGNYQLHYEDMGRPRLQKKQKRLADAKKAFYGKHIRLPKFRLFKRVRRLEGKLDQPYLYDSSLLYRIEQLEQEVAKKK